MEPRKKLISLGFLILLTVLGIYLLRQDKSIVHLEGYSMIDMGGPDEPTECSIDITGTVLETDILIKSKFNEDINIEYSEGKGILAIGDESEQLYFDEGDRLHLQRGNNVILEIYFCEMPIQTIP